MSEQEPNPTQSNEAYLAQHPNAVTDLAKAEHMAYASKADEEAVVEYGKTALERVERLGMSDNQIAGESTERMPPNSLRERNANSANALLDQAKHSRKLADEKAETAGYIYDSVQTLKSGKTLDS